MASNCGPILIVDGDPECRRVIARALERAGYSSFEAATGQQALAAALRERPALVILEVHLPGGSGYEVCRELREWFGETLPIVFVSGERTEPSDQVAGLLVGANDYIVKPFVVDVLLARLRQLVALSSPIGSATASRLTPRELEVLALLVEGLQQAEIAKRLSISPKTVGKHIEHILSKLGVHSRAQAVAFAVRDDVVDSSEEHPSFRARSPEDARLSKSGGGGI
jgi:DNA-binding NarL/FixJ family response regulator